MVAPRPTPTSAMYAAMRTKLVRASRVRQQREADRRADVPPTRKRFQRPVGVMTRPTTSDDTARPRIIGIVRRPDTVGDSPRAIWKYCARKTVAPNIATPTNRPADGREG